MKIIVITKAKPLQNETYFGVASNIKNAEKLIRNEYPHMRKIDGGYSSDKDNTYFLFLREEEVF